MMTGRLHRSAAPTLNIHELLLCFYFYFVFGAVRLPRGTMHDRPPSTSTLISAVGNYLLRSTTSFLALRRSVEN